MAFAPNQFRFGKVLLQSIIASGSILSTVDGSRAAPHLGARRGHPNYPRVRVASPTPQGYAGFLAPVSQQAVPAQQPGLDAAAYGYHNPPAKDTMTVYHGTSWEVCKEVSEDPEHRMKLIEKKRPCYGNGIYTADKVQTVFRQQYDKGCVMEIQIEINSQYWERGNEIISGKSAFSSSHSQVKKVEFQHSGDYYIINPENAFFDSTKSLGIFKKVRFFDTRSIVYNPAGLLPCLLIPRVYHQGFINGIFNIRPSELDSLDGFHEVVFDDVEDQEN